MPSLHTLYRISIGSLLVGQEVCRTGREYIQGITCFHSTRNEFGKSFTWGWKKEINFLHLTSVTSVVLCQGLCYSIKGSIQVQYRNLLHAAIVARRLLNNGISKATKERIQEKNLLHAFTAVSGFVSQGIS